MRKEPKTKRLSDALTGTQKTPPGATRKAFDRDMNPGGGPAGSGGGPRHAAADEGSDNESTGRPNDATAPEQEDRLEQGPPYAGVSGGAVGGTPAEGRASGGHVGHGIKPGPHRGESTVGTDPEERE